MRQRGIETIFRTNEEELHDRRKLEQKGLYQGIMSLCFVANSTSQRRPLKRALRMGDFTEGVDEDNPTSIYLAWLSLFLWEAALNLIATLYLTVCWEQCPSNCRQTPFFQANRSGRSGIYNIYRYSIWCRCFTTDFPFMCLPDSQRSQGLVLVEDSVGPLGGWVPEKYC